MWALDTEVYLSSYSYKHPKGDFTEKSTWEMPVNVGAS